MNKSVLILLAIFIFSIALRVMTLNQIGRTWDEPLYMDHGYNLIELIKKGDFDNNYFYTTYDHPPLVKYLYGITAHFDVKNVASSKSDIFTYDFTYSRLLSAITFSLGVLIVVVIGWQLGSILIGIFAGIILAMLPFTLGLSQLVTAESMKIFIYPLAFYSYLVLIKKYSLKKLIIAGTITGIALQVKQSNILLLPLLGLMYLVHNKLEFKKYEIKKIFVRVVGITIISGIVFIVFWPHIIFYFNEIRNIHSGYWDVKFSPNPLIFTLAPPEVFMGSLRIVPVFYYAVYFFITIPVIVLALFLFGVKKILHTKNWIFVSLLLWFLVPFAMSFYSWRQHGLRYIIEIYPAISLIAAVGFYSFVSKITQSEKKKALFFIPVVLYLTFILWQIKPYYLDYFNEIVGGTNTVYKYNLFQQGWWGQGIREGGLYLKNKAEPGSLIGYALSPDHALPTFKEFKYEKYINNKNYDYVIVNHYNIIREGFDPSEIKKKYQLIYEVKADNASLVFIYKKK